MSDEGSACLNNPKGWATPFWGDKIEQRLQKNFPPYENLGRPILLNEIAEMLGMKSLTPKAFFAIIENESFFDITEDNTIANWDSSISPGSIRKGDKEKLCLCQEYIDNTERAFTFYNKLVEEKFEAGELLSLIAPPDYENIMILCWISYANDFHGSNILLYEKPTLKKTDSYQYGLKIIDNEHCFPEQNSLLYNMLANKEFPHKYFLLSKKAKKTIRSFPTKDIVERMKVLKLEKAIAPFLERMEVLQKLIENHNYSFLEINIRLDFLEFGECSGIGKDIAFLSLEDLEIIHQKYSSEVL